MTLRPEPAGLGLPLRQQIIATDRRGKSAVLCCNHEFTNRAIMFPPANSAAKEREALKVTMAAQGFSVLAMTTSGRECGSRSGETVSLP